MPMQATLILPLADGPGCPMLKRGNVKAAAANAEDFRNVRRLGRERGELGRFIAGDDTARGSSADSRAMNSSGRADSWGRGITGRANPPGPKKETALRGSF